MGKAKQAKATHHQLSSIPSAYLLPYHHFFPPSSLLPFHDPLLSSLTISSTTPTLKSWRKCPLVSPSPPPHLRPHHLHTNNHAVLDGGTGFLKVGYAAQVQIAPPPNLEPELTSQNFPEHQFPSIVGRPILRTEEQAGDIVVKDIMCGDEAAAARSMLQISYPV